MDYCCIASFLLSLSLIWLIVVLVMASSLSLLSRTLSICSLSPLVLSLFIVASALASLPPSLSLVCVASVLPLSFSLSPLSVCLSLSLAPRQLSVRLTTSIAVTDLEGEGCSRLSVVCGRCHCCYRRSFWRFKISRDPTRQSRTIRLSPAIRRRSLY